MIFFLILGIVFLVATILAMTGSQYALTTANDWFVLSLICFFIYFVLRK